VDWKENFMSKTELKYLFLVIVIFVASGIETDIYLPAFPDMMAWFSCSEGAIQSLLTWNFVGICVSGPIYGPLSDALGRKKPLMAALGIFLAGSLMTLFAQDLTQMLIGRIFQGLGSGGCFTLGIAIIFDSFEKNRAIQATNNLNTIMPLIMAAAPMAGGMLNQSFGFHSNFLLITLLVLLSFAVCFFFFDETLPKEKRTPVALKSILRDFKLALSNVSFWQLTIAMSLLFAGYIAFLSGTSVLFVLEFGMSKAIFPFVQAAILGGWVIASLLLKRVLAKWGIPKVKKLGLLLCCVGGVGLGISTLFAPREPYLLTSWVVLYAFGANWIIGLYFPEGMGILPNIKGITASLLTSVRLLIAALIIGLTSSLYNGTVYPYSAVVFGSVVAILPILLLYERAKEHKLASPPR